MLGRFADELESRAEDTATRVSSQNGMPITLARQFEGGFPPILLRYYADMASKQEDEIRPGMLGGSTLVTRSPIGVVGAIVPWNVPQAITFLKVAPALAAGCTVVLKPSPETVLDAFLMAEAAIAARLPSGVLNIVPGGRELGAYLVAHRGHRQSLFHRLHRCRTRHRPHLRRTAPPPSPSSSAESPPPSSSTTPT